jgi:steroid delta-isomerase-like uncharacterized protein
MRTIVITGWVMGALLLAACDEKSSGSSETPAQSASANAAVVPTATATSSGNAKTEPPKSDKDKDKNEKIEAPKDHVARVKALDDAFAAHDAKKIADLYAPDAVVRTAGMPEVKGRENIAKEAEKMFAVFKDAKLTHGRVWEKDKHTVVVESVFTGTNTGDAPEMGIPKATNKPVGIVGAAWIEVADDGFIKEEHRYHDSPTSMGQLVPDPKNPVRAVITAPPNGTEKYDALNGAEVKEEEKKADKDKEKGEKGKAEKAEKDKGELSKMVAAEKAEVELENKFVAALNAGKLDDGLKLCADDILFVDYTTAADVKGKKAFKDTLGMYLTAFPDMKAKITQAFGDRDYAVLEFEYTGTQKGPLGPIKPTNKAADIHQIEVDQFKDGKFVKSWAWGNNLELLTELGVTPGAGPAPAPSTAPSAKPAK